MDNMHYERLPDGPGKCQVMERQALEQRVRDLERWQADAVTVLGGVRNYDLIQRLLSEAQPELPNPWNPGDPDMPGELTDPIEEEYHDD